LDANRKKTIPLVFNTGYLFFIMKVLYLLLS
jgi:hypothetical protein